MSNRAYLYSHSNRPTADADRPETISGLSEWSYAVPFSYRVLMSGDPQLCSSSISDGFDSEPAGAKTKLYAISGDFDAETETRSVSANGAKFCTSSFGTERSSIRRSSLRSTKSITHRAFSGSSLDAGLPWAASH